MSDEERDTGAGDGGSTFSSPRSDEAEIVPEDLSGISDPGVASRLEMVHSSMSTLSMRVDALVTSTTSYRSAMTDRLNEYADLVTKLTRTQATDIEEYRRANERTLDELRRGLAASEETLERVGARVESLLTGSDSSDESTRRALAEVRSILEAQDNLGRSLVDERLVGIEDRLAVVASTDTAAALGNRFDTLHAAIEDLESGLRAELGGAGKIATESFGELAGLRSQVDALLESSANESGAVTGTLEQLKETLQDLASGEVVGALWDEVRQMRATVEALVDRDASSTDPEAVAVLQREVTELTASVRDLLAQAEVVDDVPEPAAGVHLASLVADVAALREELARGLVIDIPEPADPAPAEMSPELEAELHAVRTGVEDIIGRLDEGLVLADDAAARPVEVAPEIADQVATLRDQVTTEFERLRQMVAGGGETVDQVATLRDQVTTEFERLRQMVAGGGETVDLTPLTARLDRLHDDLAEQLPASEDVSVDLSPVLVALREIQDGIVHLLDRPVVEVAPAATPDLVPASDGYATVDPDVIDLLREEIRSAGTVSDGIVETLSAELKALRRRIRLRAEGEIFGEDQLEMIADAVARKLGE